MGPRSVNDVLPSQAPTTTERFFRDAVTPFVVRCKHAIVFLFGALLIVSIFSLLKLHASKSIPQLFPDDHNVQQFIDVQNKFSGGVECSVSSHTAARDRSL